MLGLRHSVNGFGGGIAGYDGNNLPDDELWIPRKCIKQVDLDNIGRITPDKKYDIAMTLETAEHLHPGNEAAFVGFLCRSADFVLFSAAIPYQEGIGHIDNKPMQFWVDLFAGNGFKCFDIIRPWLIQHSDEAARVAPYYTQNILVFARGSKEKLLRSKGFSPVVKPTVIYCGWLVESLVDRLVQSLRPKAEYFKSYLRLFGIPLVKIKRKDGGLFKFYLFGFIPFMAFKRK